MKFVPVRPYVMMGKDNVKDSRSKKHPHAIVGKTKVPLKYAKKENDGRWKGPRLFPASWNPGSMKGMARGHPMIVRRSPVPTMASPATAGQGAVALCR